MTCSVTTMVYSIQDKLVVVPRSNSIKANVLYNHMALHQTFRYKDSLQVVKIYIEKMGIYYLQNKTLLVIFCTARFKIT